MPRIMIDEAKTWKELMTVFFQEKADTIRVKHKFEESLSAFRKEVEAGVYIAPDGVTKYSDLMKRCRDGIKNCDAMKKRVDAGIEDLAEKFLTQQLEKQNELN